MNEFTIIKLSPVGKPIYNSDEVELRVIGIFFMNIFNYYYILMRRKCSSNNTKRIENYYYLIG